MDLHLRIERRPARIVVPPRRGRRTAVSVVVALLGTLGAVAAGPAPAGALTTTPLTARVSLSSVQAATTKPVVFRPHASADGRFVAFTTEGQLTPGDANGKADVYLRDRLTDETAWASRGDADTALNGFAYLCGMSDDARWIAFRSNGQYYLHDRIKGDTELVSLTGGGAPSNDNGLLSTIDCDVSDDGRYVAFTSTATNLDPPDTNAASDVYLRDRQAGTTVRVSRTADATQGNKASYDPSMNATGSSIAFSSDATNLVAGDTNAARDIFVRQPAANATYRASVKGASGHLTGNSTGATMNATGNLVAFMTDDDSAVDGDDNGKTDVVLRNVGLASNEVVSVSSNESLSNGFSAWPSISTDGRYVAFESTGTNLYPADGNGVRDVFVRDRQAGLTFLGSRRNGSIQAGNAASTLPSISNDGRVVAFNSGASDLVRNDTNGVADAFARDTGVGHAPFDSFLDLAKQQAADFLTTPAMAPHESVAIGYADAMAQGELSPDALIDQVAHSTVFAGPRAPVIRLYWAFFLRRPDAGGLNYWIAQYKTKSLPWIASQFAKSSEFQTTYGSLSNSGFVQLVYQNVLERDADADGLAFWTAQLDSGAKTRGDVMTGFSESSEGRRFLAPPVDTILLYLGMLGTVPSKDAFAFAVAAMKAGAPPEELARSIRALPAYIARF